MGRRTKLICLLSLDAILVSGVVALATLLLAADGSAGRTAACAQERPSTRESFVPANTTFTTIQAAEAFICHEVVYPRDTAGWELEHISGSRTGPAAYVGRGQGFASITLDYALPGSNADLRLEVSPFRIDPILYGIVDRVEIMGAEANVIRGKDAALHILQWEADGFSFYAEARLHDGFDLPHLIAILDSIR